MIVRQSVPNPQGCVENVFSAGGAEEIFSGNLRGGGAKNPVEVVRSCVCQITFGEDFFCDAALSRGPFRRRILWQQRRGDPTRTP